MSFVPAFKLYNSTGLSLLYTFVAVQKSNHPHSPRNFIEIEGTRGKGSIIIDGGESAWDLIIEGRLYADDYEALVVLMDAMESTIALNTAYKVKIDKTDATYYEYDVKRIVPIEWGDTNFRNNYIDYKVILKVNSW